MKYPLLYLLTKKLKGLKSYYIIAKRNPSCEIRSTNVSREAVLGKHLIIREGVQITARSSIGDYARINKNTTIINANIGRYCSIGYNTIIGPPNHLVDAFTTSNAILYIKELAVLFPNQPHAMPPQIGNDVWIAANCLVLQGVSIGDGAVIAGGSVVTKDVEAGWIYGGVPAKKIRRRKVDELSLSKLGEDWYDLDLETLVDRLTR